MHYQTGIRFSHHILELKGTWETHNSNVKSKVCVYVFAEMVSCLWEDSSRERGVPTSWEAWPTMNDLKFLESSYTELQSAALQELPFAGCWYRSPVSAATQN